MAAFPLLKTGAVSQYPSSKALEFSTTVLRYVDGSEQRFRTRPAIGHRWLIDLRAVSPEEAGVIRAFVEAHRGRFGTFSFQDPWTGTVYDNCSFDGDSLELNFQTDWRVATEVVIRDNEA